MLVLIDGSSSTQMARGTKSNKRGVILCQGAFVIFSRLLKIVSKTVLACAPSSQPLTLELINPPLRGVFPFTRTFVKRRVFYTV